MFILLQLLTLLKRQNEVSEAVNIADAKLQAFDSRAADAATASVHGEAVRAKLELATIQRELREMRIRMAGSDNQASILACVHLFIFSFPSQY